MEPLGPIRVRKVGSFENYFLLISYLLLAMSFMLIFFEFQGNFSLSNLALNFGVEINKNLTSKIYTKRSQ